MNACDGSITWTTGPGGLFELHRVAVYETLENVINTFYAKDVPLSVMINAMREAGWDNGLEFIRGRVKIV